MYSVHPRSVLTSDASHASFGLRVRDPARGGRSRPTNRNSVTLSNYITLVYREAEGRTDEEARDSLRSSYIKRRFFFSYPLIG